MTTKIPIELSSTPGIVDSTNTTALTLDASQNAIFAGTVTGSRKLVLNASGTNDTHIEIGANTASNHYAFIDLVGDATYSDYGLRIIRNNSGANTSSFIYHRGTGNFNIETQDSASIKLRTAGADALTIDTSQRVGIGTNSPSHKLDVEGGNNVFDIARFGSSASDNSEITIGYFDANATNGIPGLIEASDFGGLIQGGENGHFVLGIRDNDASDALDIVSGGGNFMSDSTYDTLVATFKASGNVGIGTNPAFRFHAYHPTTNVVGRFESGDNQVWIDLHDDGSGNYGALLGHDSDANVLFQVADASVNTKLIIKDTGELGIGTSPATHYTGYEALDIGNVLSLFSNNSGTNVSTLTNNGYLNSSASQWTYKVTDEATMYSQVHGDHRFSTAASGSANGAITWSEKVRFQNAGGISFNGDTAAANALDDYEEGSWTPTASTSNGNGSFSVTVNYAKYIKVGGLVHASCYLSIIVSNVGSGAAIIGGLPFVNTSGQGYSIASVGHASAIQYHTNDGVAAYVTNGHNYIRHVNVTDTGNVGWSGTGTKYYMMSCTYHSV